LWATIQNMVRDEHAQAISIWDYPLLKDLDPGLDEFGLVDPDTIN